MKKVTLKDIANEVGVSTMTVSKALNDKSDISIELKNRIVETAINMGYIKNNKSLETIYNFIFVITDRFFFETDQFYSAIYQSISKLCHEKNCNLAIEIIHDDIEKKLIIPESITTKNAHGIFMVGEVSAEYLSKILSYSIPTICIDFFKKEFPDLCYILTDNVSGSYKITKYLISLGHTYFAFVGDPNFSSSIKDRREGFLDALKDYNITEIPIFFSTPEELMNFPRSQMPTAIFATSDGVANVTIKYLDARGFKIPEDISVAGFDNIPLSKLGLKDITTVDVNKVKMGQLGFEALYNMVTKNIKSSLIQLDTEVIVRDSTWVCKNI